MKFAYGKNFCISKIKKYLIQFLKKLNKNNANKRLEIAKWINKVLELDKESEENHKIKETHEKSYHPRRPLRGDVYMAEIGSNVGFEFNDYHPVLIYQNDTGNTYGDTTIVLPITDFGNGTKYDKNIHHKIYNSDFESVEKNGLDKSPSIVKLSDIVTIDKARLKTKIGKVKDDYFKLINPKVKNILGILDK